MSFGFHRRPRGPGFTLIELLLVLAILGALVVIVSPYIGAGMSGTQLATAARSVVQASKYARTMALLHQAETELVLTSAEGEGGSCRIEVRAVTGADVAFELADIAAARVEARENGTDAEWAGVADGDVADEAPPLHSAAAETAQSFADEVSMKFECQGVVFDFEGYTDTLEDGEEDDAKDGEDEELFVEHPVIRLLFKSNGTCRPFQVRVGNGDEQSFVISVDMTGRGKIEGYGDDE